MRDIWPSRPDVSLRMSACVCGKKRRSASKSKSVGLKKVVHALHERPLNFCSLVRFLILSAGPSAIQIKISVPLYALKEPNFGNCVISTHLFAPFFPKSVTFRYTCPSRQL